MVSHDLDMLAILVYPHLGGGDGGPFSKGWIQRLAGRIVCIEWTRQNHLTKALISNRGKLTNAWQLSGRYIFFCFFQVLGFNWWNIPFSTPVIFFGFFLVNFELTQPSPSIATSGTWLKPVVCKNWTQIALVLALASWNITEPLEGRPTKTVIFIFPWQKEPFYG